MQRITGEKQLRARLLELVDNLRNGIKAENPEVDLVSLGDDINSLRNFIVESMPLGTDLHPTTAARVVQPEPTIEPFEETA